MQPAGRLYLPPHRRRPRPTLPPAASATPWPSPVFPTEIPSATAAPTATRAASATARPSPTANPTHMPSQPLAASPTANTAPTALPDISQITATDWVTGPADAPVTIIEYGDYQCASCALLTAVLLQVQQDFPDDVRLVHRHYPMIWLNQDGQPARDESELATEAAEAAGAQGKFWAMHAVLSASYTQWAHVAQRIPRLAEHVLRSRPAWTCRALGPASMNTPTRPR